MLLIRPENATDAAGIRAIHAAAFPTTDEARLVDALRAADKATVSIVATLDAELAGHCLLSPVELGEVCAADGGLGLAPVAVFPSRQGQGIGGWLIVASIAAARRLGYRFIVVLGKPGYYSRFGFEAASRYGLANDYGAGDEFMVRPLHAVPLPPEGGVIHYAREFAALSQTEANL